jgi:hypothetical protein
VLSRGCLELELDVDMSDHAVRQPLEVNDRRPGRDLRPTGPPGPKRSSRSSPTGLAQRQRKHPFIFLGIPPIIGG